MLPLHHALFSCFLIVAVAADFAWTPPPTESVRFSPWRCPNGQCQRSLADGAVEDRVAICLIGSARHFELNSVSLKRFLLQAYPRSDVFVVASLDHTSWKLFMLSQVANLVSFSITPQSTIDESLYPTHILQVPSVQGQLHQFMKIEHCIEPITSYERNHSFTYDWILWTRLDSFWSAPPPPISSLDPMAYIVPSGQGWGGVNDRCGIGPRHLALPALKRLSSLADLAAANKSGLNGEKSLMEQLILQHIPFRLEPLPFCILSFRRKKSKSYLFARLRTPEAVGGISCRPCPINSNSNPTSHYCNAFAVYEKGWEEEFLSGADEEERQVMTGAQLLDRKKCEEDWKMFEEESEARGVLWSCLPAFKMCKKMKMW